MRNHSEVQLQISGDYALFSDIIVSPGGEKTSYQIPTYEAVKGILQSVFWKPTFEWVIDSIRVMNPIRTERVGVKTLKYNEGGNDLSYYTYLRDVKYQVKAHFRWNMNRPELAQDRNECKHSCMANRMIKAGGRRDVFLGTRDCQAYVEPCLFGEGDGYYDHSGDIPYGIMYHGITYPDEAIRAEDKGCMTIRLWTPVMRNGIIQFDKPEDCPYTRKIKKMLVKRFHDPHATAEQEEA